MKQFLIMFIVTVVGGLTVVVCWVWLEPRVRDRYSIQKERLEDGTSYIKERAIVKTKGWLSMRDRPIFIHNEGTIQKIEIREDQNQLADVIHIDKSNAIIIPKGLMGDNLYFYITTASPSTVTSSSKLLFLPIGIPERGIPERGIP